MSDHTSADAPAAVVAKLVEQFYQTLGAAQTEQAGGSETFLTVVAQTYERLYGRLIDFSAEGEAVSPADAAVLQTIIDNLPSGVTLFDGDLDMIACNQRFQHLLGFPDTLFADGLPSFRTLIAFNVARGEYGPGDPDALTDQVLERARRAEAHVFERERPDGTVLEIRGTPLPGGGFVSIYTDITVRKRAEEEARRLAAYLKAVLNALPQGVSVIDEHLRVRVWNSAFERVLNLPPELMRDGMEFQDIIRFNAERGEYGPCDVDAVVRQRCDRAMRFEPHRFERARPDGTILDVEGRPVMMDDRVVGFVTTYTDVTEVTEARRKLEHLATHDQLTGLANRRLLQERFALEMARRRRDNRPLAMLVIDVDHFKQVNDSHGHLVGDACLRGLAALLNESVRATDLVARFGGEEFLVLMPETDAAGAAVIARKLADRARETAIADSPRVCVTLSIGIAVAAAGEDPDLDRLIHHADLAVYEAKRQGRDRVVDYRALVAVDT